MRLQRDVRLMRSRSEGTACDDSILIEAEPSPHLWASSSHSYAIPSAKAAFFRHRSRPGRIATRVTSAYTVLSACTVALPHVDQCCNVHYTF